MMLWLALAVLLQGAESDSLDYIWTRPQLLQSYAWDGGPHVMVNARGPRRITFGEHGVSEATEVYATFNEGSGSMLHLTGMALTAETPVGGSWVEGRFGAGLLLAADDVVAFEDAGGSPSAAWTLGFFVSPRGGLDGRLPVLDMPGIATVRILRNGFVRAEVGTTPPLILTSAVGLNSGAWNHVAVVVDGRDLGRARLYVNGEGRGEPLPPFEPRPFEGFVISSGAGVLAIDELVLESRAATTDELRRYAAAEPRLGSHRLRMFGEQRVFEHELWHGVARTRSLAGEGLRQGELSFLRFADDGLVRTPAQWERLETNGPPLARTTHPTVYVGRGRTFLFGGETRDTHVRGFANTNDTWILEAVADRRAFWRRIEGEVTPPPSCHQAAAFSPDHGVVLYAGGWRNDVKPSVTYDDTWLYHVEEERWERMEPTGAEFRAKRDCSLVYHEGAGKFLMFLNASGLVMTYDPDANVWEQLPRAEREALPGERPAYRPNGSPMAVYEPVSELVWLFGGVERRAGEDLYHSRVAFYDLARNTYTTVPVEVAPEGRLRSGFAYDSNRGRMVLYGGVRGQFSERYDDLWVFDPRKLAWRQLAFEGGPGKRGGYYGMAFDPERDSFTLLCGRSEVERFLDEAWSLRIDDEAWGRASYVFELDDEAAPVEAFARWRGARGRVSLFARRGDGTSFGPWAKSGKAPEGAGRFVQVEVALAPGGRDLTLTEVGLRQKGTGAPLAAGLLEASAPLGD